MMPNLYPHLNEEEIIRRTAGPGASLLHISPALGGENNQTIVHNASWDLVGNILVSYNCMISFLHLSNLYSCKLYKFLNQIKKKNSFIRVSDIRLKVIFFIAQNNLSSSIQWYACLYLQ
ncbi:unnamed protein product [Musa acuminata subsp. burmannicoides]